MNSRQKGQRNELRTQKLLEAQGYYVLRWYQPWYAAQGEIDLVAIKPGEVLFVQVKSNRWGNVAYYQPFADKIRGAKVGFKIYRWDDRVAEAKVREL